MKMHIVALALLLVGVPAFSQIPMDRVAASLKKNGIFWAGEENYDPDHPDTPAVKINGELDYKAAVAGRYKASDIIFVSGTVMNIENNRAEGTVYYWVSTINNPDEIFLVVAKKIHSGWKKLGRTYFLGAYSKTVGATLTNPETAEEEDLSVPVLTLLIGGQEDLLPKK